MFHQNRLRSILKVVRACIDGKKLPILCSEDSFHACAKVRLNCQGISLFVCIASSKDTLCPEEDIYKALKLPNQVHSKPALLQVLPSIHISTQEAKLLSSKHPTTAIIIIYTSFNTAPHNGSNTIVPTDYSRRATKVCVAPQRGTTSSLPWCSHQSCKI